MKNNRNQHSICLILLLILRRNQSITLSEVRVEPKLIFGNESHKQIRLSLTDRKSIDIFVDNSQKYLNLSQRVDILDNSCLFSGRIVAKESVIGTALINVCPNSSRMIGILEDFDHQLYSLTPEEDSNLTRIRRSADTQEHRLDKIPRASNKLGICGNYYSDPTLELPVHLRVETEIPDDYSITFGAATINLAVYMDHHLFGNRFQSNDTLAKQFLAIHMAYLQRQLQQKTIHKHIQFKLVVIHFGIVPFTQTHHWSTNQFLSEFCQWATDQPIGAQADLKILFTGQNLWHEVNGEINGLILGLSYTRQLCLRQYNCLILESVNGFLSLHTLVHEFGHSLGAHHDGDKRGEECDDSQFIMSPFIASGKSYWSECSVREFRQHLLSLDRYPNNTVECLNDRIHTQVVDHNTDEALRPGRHHSADQQCRDIFGQKYHYRSSKYDNICRELSCQNSFFAVLTSGALEGTKCGPNWVCDRDICRRFGKLTD